MQKWNYPLSILASLFLITGCSQAPKPDDPINTQTLKQGVIIVANLPEKIAAHYGSGQYTLQVRAVSDQGTVEKSFESVSAGSGSELSLKEGTWQIATQLKSVNDDWVLTGTQNVTFLKDTITQIKAGLDDHQSAILVQLQSKVSAIQKLKIELTGSGSPMTKMLVATTNTCVLISTPGQYQITITGLDVTNAVLCSKTFSATLSGGVEKLLSVTVTNPASPQIACDWATPISLELLASAIQVEKGDSSALSVRCTPEALAETLVWESTDPSIATVDQSGNIQGIKAGSAIIRVYSSLKPSEVQQVDVTVIASAPDVGLPQNTTIVKAEKMDEALLAASPDTYSGEDITMAIDNRIIPASALQKDTTIIIQPCETFPYGFIGKVKESENLTPQSVQAQSLLTRLTARVLNRTLPETKNMIPVITSVMVEQKELWEVVGGQLDLFVDGILFELVDNSNPNLVALTLRLDFNSEVHIADYKLNQFSTRLNAKEKVEFIKGMNGFKWSKDVMPPKLQPKVFMAGPVPVLFLFVTRLTVDFDILSTNLSLEPLSMTMTLGTQYVNNGWQGIPLTTKINLLGQEFDPAQPATYANLDVTQMLLNAVGNLEAETGIDVMFGPRFGAYLYGLAGPAVEAKGGVRFSASSDNDNPALRVLAKIRATLYPYTSVVSDLRSTFISELSKVEKLGWIDKFVIRQIFKMIEKLQNSIMGTSDQGIDFYKIEKVIWHSQPIFMDLNYKMNGPNQVEFSWYLTKFDRNVEKIIVTRTRSGDPFSATVLEFPVSITAIDWLKTINQNTLPTSIPAYFRAYALVQSGTDQLPGAGTYDYHFQVQYRYEENDFVYQKTVDVGDIAGVGGAAMPGNIDLTMTVPADIESVSVYPKSFSMTESERFPMTVTTVPSGAEVIWMSSNPAVVEVNEVGQITAISKGAAVIRAIASADGSVSDTCAITVHEIGE